MLDVDELIVVGSMNSVKLQAVMNAFAHTKVLGLESASGVPAQPIGHDQTRKGAENRAIVSWKNAKTQGQFPQLAVGLEGGVEILRDECWLINWGALFDGQELYFSSGPILKLPSSFIEAFQAGLELAQIMQKFSHHFNIKQGAMGFFSDGLISRELMFRTLTLALRGQWQAGKKGYYSSSFSFAV